MFSIQNDTSSSSGVISLLQRTSPNTSVPLLSLSDVPNTAIQNVPFTYRDIATQVDVFIKAVQQNASLQQYLVDPMTSNPAIILNANRVLANLARNFCNDPSSPPPAGFIKRITVLANDGQVLVDVFTYVPSVPELNFDRNIVYMNSWYNPLPTPNPAVYPINSINIDIPASLPYMNSDVIFNANFVDVASIASTSKGIQLQEQAILVESARTYAYPANVVNPAPTLGSGANYSLVPSMSTNKEVMQATVQRWGWASRKSGRLQLPSYFVANFNEGVDGYSLVVRMAYVKL